MKKTRLVISYFFALTLSHCYAGATVINTEDHPSGRIYLEDAATSVSAKTELRLLQKEERRIVRVETLLKRIFTPSRLNHHTSIDFKDSVNKWFWLWILGWGAGALITILSGGAVTAGAIGILWFASFIFGSIGLVIWLVKKFG